MVKFQRFNNKIRAWVILKTTPKGVKILNVKQRKPMMKFVGVPVRKMR